MSLDATGPYLIPLRSWHRAQQPPAIGIEIGEVVVEGSAIGFLDPQGTYKDNRHKGQRLHEL